MRAWISSGLRATVAVRDTILWCISPDQRNITRRSATGLHVGGIVVPASRRNWNALGEEFCQRLHNDLQAAGVRCWFAPGAEANA